MKILSKSVEETNKIAKDFLNKINNLKNDKALVVGLFGDLGSGKTAFTQALGKIIGVKEVMTSPTFVIEKIYKLENNNYKNLIHIDAYRLESGRELLNLGFVEIMKKTENLILIEWPERVADVMPADLIKINFKFVTENEREIDMI